MNIIRLIGVTVLIILVSACSKKEEAPYNGPIALETIGYVRPVSCERVGATGYQCETNNFSDKVRSNVNMTCRMFDKNDKQLGDKYIIDGLHGGIDVSPNEKTKFTSSFPQGTALILCLDLGDPDQVIPMKDQIIEKSKQRGIFSSLTF